MHTIYFMDFINQNFQNPEVLRKIVLLRTESEDLSWKEIFEACNIQRLKRFFSETICWPDDYKILGFDNIQSLWDIHSEWREKIGKVLDNNGQIVFKKEKELERLKINFE